MIISFADKRTEKVWLRERVPGLPLDIQRKAAKQLLHLNAASKLDDLREPPGNFLKKLLGSRTGQYSIRINDQWRICFHWTELGVEGVEIVDYH